MERGFPKKEFAQTDLWLRLSTWRIAWRVVSAKI